MSVLDRMKRQPDQQETTDKQDIPSSSLALVDPPVIQRVKQLVQFAVEYAKTDGTGIPWYVESLITEVIDEISNVNPDDATHYLLFTADIMRWAATGDYSDLPEAFRTRETLALTSSDDASAHQ